MYLRGKIIRDTESAGERKGREREQRGGAGIVTNFTKGDFAEF